MKNLLKAGLILGFFLVVSCAKDNSQSSGTRTTRAGTGNVSPNSAQAVNTGWGPLQTSQVSRVTVGYTYSKAKVAYNQADAAAGLASTGMDVSTLGYIEENGSTKFAGILSFSNGNVVASKTRIGIVIFDNVALENPEKAIGIYMGPERGVTPTGNLYGNSSNGNFSLNFSDLFGSIRLSGQISGGQAYIDIYYTNKGEKYYFNGEEVYLGTATVPTNGLIFN